jgi:hypothetical protein
MGDQMVGLEMPQVESEKLKTSQNASDQNQSFAEDCKEGIAVEKMAQGLMLEQTGLIDFEGSMEIYNADLRRRKLLVGTMSLMTFLIVIGLVILLVLMNNSSYYYYD